MEHFVNLPRDATGLADDPCPTADRCVVSAIGDDLAVLGRPDASAAQKLDALKYLGHWVGDVHQPMHVSFEDDRGGNGIAVTGLCGAANLHSAWDNCILERTLGSDASAIAAALTVEITPAEKAAWSSSARKTGPTIVPDHDRPGHRLLRRGELSL